MTKKSTTQLRAKSNLHSVKRISVRKSPAQTRSNESLQRILSATLHIIEEQGLDRVTTGRIAERAGLSVGVLYQYFRNKETVLFALATNRVADFDKIFEEVKPNDYPNAADWISILVERHWVKYRDDVVLTRNIAYLATLPEIAELYDRFYERMQEYFAGGFRHFEGSIEGEDARALATIIMGTIHGVLFQAIDERKEVANKIIQILKQTLMMLLIGRMGPS